jgi:hypothetical protein
MMQLRFTVRNLLLFSLSITLKRKKFTSTYKKRRSYTEEKVNG